MMVQPPAPPRTSCSSAKTASMARRRFESDPLHGRCSDSNSGALFPALAGGVAGRLLRRKY